jgi:murein DD-endopeptidase MepM/ murein hydrolase activator NlpD
MEPTRFTTMLEEAGSSASQGGGCIAYVAATGGEAGVASVIFRYTEPSGEPRTIAFHKTLDGVIATPGVCDCRESTRRIVSLPAQEFATSISSVSESIPENVRWQLNILVPRMIAGLSAKRTADEPVSEGGPEAGATNGESEPQQAEAPTDSYAVRVIFGHYGDDERERLESVEIVDPASGKRVNGAWWLDRPDGPGVIIGMDGLAYERLLWESPVKYTRSARGVGASTSTWRRRVPAKKGSPKSTVVKTINVPSYHLGVDMTAPRGTDVHAVGDAKVSFSGRMGGFGNLIILDHGRGYTTYYAHLSKIRKGLKAGVQVARGEMIGLVGSTGHSTAPHLHFETRKDARYLDPFDESHQLGFWVLTADEQERLAMQLLSPAPVVAEGDLAPRER